ncbi:MAG: hypothetical protein ACOYEH_05315 [Caldicoprobacterales bacterium]|jgi:hypothetical protein|nr:hypothetical protein [Clostridiales bacterium]
MAGHNKECYLQRKTPPSSKKDGGVLLLVMINTANDIKGGARDEFMNIYLEFGYI